MANLGQVFPEKGLDAFCDELICLAAGNNKAKAIGINRTLKGRELTVLINWSVLPGYEESWEKVVVSMIDITREREIDQLKNEFISIAAHELRTPLASIMGYSELLQMDEADKFSPKMTRECFGNIQSSILSLERIIDDLLDVSKIESGRSLLIDKAEIDFSELLATICENHQRETKKHIFQLELPKAPISLFADQGRITQVLDNLLSNAIKYTPNGGAIRISGKIEDDQLCVSISDEGIGMTEQQAQRVFDKFYRADTSNTAVRGLGLGMNIAKNIIEGHGGTIWVESVAGEGTTVYFTIPR